MTRHMHTLSLCGWLSAFQHHQKTLLSLLVPFGLTTSWCVPIIPFPSSSEVVIVMGCICVIGVIDDTADHLLCVQAFCIWIISLSSSFLFDLWWTCNQSRIIKVLDQLVSSCLCSVHCLLIFGTSQLLFACEYSCSAIVLPTHTIHRDWWVEWGVSWFPSAVRKEVFHGSIQQPLRSLLVLIGLPASWISQHVPWLECCSFTSPSYHVLRPLAYHRERNLQSGSWGMSHSLWKWLLSYFGQLLVQQFQNILLSKS